MDTKETITEVENTTEQSEATPAKKAWKDMDEIERKAYNAKHKREQRAREKAQTVAGKRMAYSQTVIDKKEAIEILKERGLRKSGSTADNVRETIYWLSEKAAEALGLPGPNWHLLRYGYLATKRVMEDSDFVPPEHDPVADPDACPDGELSTNLELWCMMEMQSWNTDFIAPRPTKEEACRRGDIVVDALVGTHPDCITPEYAQWLKDVGHSIQEAIESGYKFRNLEQLWMDCAIRAELDRLGPVEEARIRALPEDERADFVADLPLVKQVIKQFDLN